jgi:predicted ATPase/class 3 adenylate cyclase
VGDIAQPSGTVTLVFTDIEGSTRLLAELGEPGYLDALSEHRAAVREAFRHHRGYEVDTQGDSFFYVFSSASEAVRAVQEAMGALEGGAIRIRVGVHTGEPHLDGLNYVGLDVHLAARIASAAHGGQVVLSRKTVTSLGDGWRLTDLGEHRVKDFSEPVWIFQVGSERFPPLRTISNTNLPRPVSSFVGRERERGEITALLQDGARLLTLSGPGGSGKTRLAIEAAAELVPRFSGVFWVGLATLRDPALVHASIAETLGAKEELAVFVGARELLLLLDNFEQVVEAAPALADLLEACPNLRLLVTSRELLRVRGEVTYPVSPLVEPEALDLFCRRSRLEPTSEIEALCRRLDNLPLALELAAARTTALSPAQILDRLAQRLDLFVGGRDADARQRTLRATIAWSYDLLEPAERRLFAGLAVFRGGCTLEAAERALGADVASLQSLVEKSLVRHTDERFWLLETIREFALERLDERSDAGHVRESHARLMLALAREAEPLLAGRGADEVVRRLDLERDNIRGALDWAYCSDYGRLGLELATVLERYWWIRAQQEGLDWLERGLAASGIPAELRCDALATTGGCAYFVGDLEHAIALFAESIELARRLGDPKRTARGLARIAPPLYVAGRVDEGAVHVEEAVAINRRIGYAFGLVESLHILAGAHSERGDLEGSQALLEESLRIAREIEDELWVGVDLSLLADTALLQGRLGEAWEYGVEGAVRALANRHESHVLQSIGQLAVIAGRRGDWQRAALLWGAAERLDGELGPTLFRHEQQKLESQLGKRDAAFEYAMAEGRALDLDDVVARALYEPFGAPPPR